MKQVGLDFAEIRIPLDLPETRQQISRYSPSGRVPVLIHDDLTVWDSLAICEYLAETFPNYRWLPEDRVARAIARSVSAEMHAGFPQLRQHMPMDCRSRLPGQGMAPGVQEDINRITTIWRDCRQKFGAEGNFLFGGFTIADAMFAPVTCRFVTYGVKLDSVSVAYVEAVQALPAMQEWLAIASAESEFIANP